MKSVERPVAGRTALEIMSRLVDVDEIGRTEVVVRVSNGDPGKRMELFVTTPTRSWSWSTSSTGEPRA